MLIKSPFHTRVLLPPNSREGNHFPRERSPFENLNKRNQKCTSVYSTMTTSVFCKSFQFTTVQAPLCCSDWGRVEFFHLKILEHLRLSALFLTCGWKFLRVKGFAGESFCGWKFLKVISNVCYAFNFQGSFWPAGEWFSCQWYSAVTVFHSTTTYSPFKMLISIVANITHLPFRLTHPVEETFDRC